MRYLKDCGVPAAQVLEVNAASLREIDTEDLGATFPCRF
jgi:hypothetical protein